MTQFTGKNKYERLKDLEKLGLNTSAAILLDPKIGLTEEFENFLSNFTQIGIRSFREDGKGSGRSPFYPQVSVEEARRLVPEILKEGYNTIVYESVPTSINIIVGTCWRRDESSFVVELANGPRTVRDLMSIGKIDSRFEINDINRLEDPRLKEVVESSSKLPVGTILEWSLHSEKVGQKKENYIYWEWLHDGLKK